MDKRAAIYARVSRPYKINDERVTIDAQIRDCESYCKLKDYEIKAYFVDKDRYKSNGLFVRPTGERTDRPNYLALLNEACKGEFDVIVAWKIDRLFRGVDAALALSEILEKCKDKLQVDVVKGYCNKETLWLQGLLSNIEVQNTRERLLLGRIAHLERGDPPGGSLHYGYHRSPEGKMTINNVEASIVQDIFNWYIAGKNLMEIRTLLQLSGNKPRGNQFWSKATISKILCFEGYIQGKYQTILNDRKFAITCPQIISLSTWETARDTRIKNTKKRGINVKEDYLCRGIVTCPCGWSWVVRTCRSKGQHGKCGYYGCARKDHQPEQVRSNCSGTIGSKKLDRYVWNYVANLCKDSRVLEIRRLAVRKEILNMREGESKTTKLIKGTEKIVDEEQWLELLMKNKKAELHSNVRTFFSNQEEPNKNTPPLLKMDDDPLDIWLSKYHQRIDDAIQILNIDTSKITPKEQIYISRTLKADRFLKKYDGDKLAALNWTIVEEKRQLIRIFVKKVMLSKGSSSEKIITLQLSFNIPEDLISQIP
jgi:site-specific DNA recombinase